MITVLVLEHPLVMEGLAIVSDSWQQRRPINGRIFGYGVDDEVLEYDSGDEPPPLNTALILFRILH